MLKTTSNLLGNLNSSTNNQPLNKLNNKTITNAPVFTNSQKLFSGGLPLNPSFPINLNRNFTTYNNKYNNNSNPSQRPSVGSTSTIEESIKMSNSNSNSSKFNYNTDNTRTHTQSHTHTHSQTQNKMSAMFPQTPDIQYNNKASVTNKNLPLMNNSPMMPTTMSEILNNKRNPPPQIPIPKFSYVVPPHCLIEEFKIRKPKTSKSDRNLPKVDYKFKSSLNSNSESTERNNKNKIPQVTQPVTKRNKINSEFYDDEISQNNNPMLQVRIKTGDNEFKVLQLKQNDDIKQTAKNFCETHNLSEKFVSPICSIIEKALESLSNLFKTNVQSNEVKQLNEIYKEYKQDESKDDSESICNWSCLSLLDDSTDSTAEFSNNNLNITI